MAKKKETAAETPAENTESTENKVENSAESKAENGAESKAGEPGGAERAELLALAALEKEAAQAKAKLAETEDRLLRTLAEYDNFKKRTVREKEELAFLSKSELIRALLPVFDNLDRAQKFSDAEEYKKGVDLILDQFFQILGGLGVTEIAKEGDRFDPNLHEAVFREEKEGVEENIITEVLQKGYAVGDKVIRHAMVKVSG